MRILLLSLFSIALAACRTAPAPNRLTLPGVSAQVVDLGERGTAYVHGTVFLPQALKDAPILYVHMEGVKTTPPSEAEIFLVEQGSKVDPALYIGSVATVSGNPEVLPSVLLEVNDFEADGRRFTARSTLRGMASFAVAVVVKRGAVAIERITLTDTSPAGR